MWRIKSAIKDCLAALVLLVLFRPFGIGGDKNPYVAIAGVVVLVFVSSLISSLLSIPFFKGEKTLLFDTELKRMNIEYIMNVPILAAFVITYIGMVLLWQHLIWLDYRRAICIMAISFCCGMRDLCLNTYLYMEQGSIEKTFPED